MRILQGHFNGQDVKLTIDHAEVPQKLNSDDVLVKTKACSIDLHKDKHKVYSQISTSVENYPIGQTISGVVVKAGSNVETFEEGADVVGFLPFGGALARCGELCVLNQYDMTKKPNNMSHPTAAAAVCAGLAAYTAVHYLGHVTAGDTVLVLDGATPRGYLSIQLAHSFGAKVLSTYRNLAEKQTLENLKSPVAQMIELTQRSTILASAVMEETGGVGVDCVIDNGVRLFTSEEDKDLMEERSMIAVPHKHDLLACLGFAGRWITSNPNLQLDPPDSQQLFLRGASVSFLFPPAWTLMRSQHGRFHHILRDLLERVEKGDFQFPEVVQVKMEKAAEYYSQELDQTKAVVIVP